jgi:hypothetical protein
MKYLLLFLTLSACQVDDSDNYYSYSGNAPTDFGTFLDGDWSNGQDFLRIEALKFSCDSGNGVRTAAIVEMQQKHLQLDSKVCGYGPIVAYQTYPPYDQLNLLRDGNWVRLWKHY